MAMAVHESTTTPTPDYETIGRQWAARHDVAPIIFTRNKVMCPWCWGPVLPSCITRFWGSLGCHETEAGAYLVLGDALHQITTQLGVSLDPPTVPECLELKTTAEERAEVLRVLSDWQIGFLASDVDTLLAHTADLQRRLDATVGQLVEQREYHVKDIAGLERARDVWKKATEKWEKNHDAARAELAKATAREAALKQERDGLQRQVQQYKIFLDTERDYQSEIAKLTADRDELRGKVAIERDLFLWALQKLRGEVQNCSANTHQDVAKGGGSARAPLSEAERERLGRIAFRVWTVTGNELDEGWEEAVEAIAAALPAPAAWHDKPPAEGPMPAPVAMKVEAAT